MRAFLLITFTLILAILLSLLPLPHWAVWIWPKWAVLVSIYWALMLPASYGVVTAWVVGLLLDLIQGTLMGEQALALSFITYIVIKFYPQIRLLIGAWRLLAVFLLVLTYQVILFALQSFLQKLPFLWQFWLASFTSALVWPILVYPFLKFCQQYFKVQGPVERRLIRT